MERRRTRSTRQTIPMWGGPDGAARSGSSVCRNPWRWSFDRGNGDLFIGDVGENLWEEIDHLPAPVVGGNNFGWPIEEGKNCFQPSTNCFTLGLVEPVFEYPHGLACAVTGGYVYRGQDFPDLQGTYFYGDFCSGVIRSFLARREYPQEELPEIGIPPVNGKADNTVSFGEDGRGELHAVMASGRDLPGGETGDEVEDSTNGVEA